jgi:phage terminase large subunit
MEVKFPKKIAWVFAGEARYRGAYGGRGSGKSYSFAKMLAIKGLVKKSRFLCAREFQNTIRDSVIQEVANAIDSEPFLRDFYDVGANYIKGKNGTEFIFKGLRFNYREVKSTSNVNICWVEEAETVSEKSWEVLTPTIRAPGSEIWLTWNPETEDSATHQRFIKKPPQNARIVKVNYNDNPWFPRELEFDRLDTYKNRPESYEHIWMGECLVNKHSQIFKDAFVVENFEEHLDRSGAPLYNGPYYGSDFGFSRDPTAFIRCYVYDNRLYITHEAGGVQIDNDDLISKVYSKIEGFDTHVVRADSARPETISYLKKSGVKRMTAAKKWKGSVEDGISHIRGYDKVVIHSRCKETLKEFKKYSYKTDRLTGDVLTGIIDAYNHYIDALRYALEPMIKRKMSLVDAILYRNK